MIENEHSDIFGLEVSDYARSLFLNMARWAKFLAIMGFIVMGIMAVALIVMVFASAAIDSAALGSSGIYGQLGMAGSAIFVLLLLGIYFYPTYALLMYAIKVKRAMLAANQGDFELSINYLKNTFKYIGILMIILLSFYDIAIIIGITVALTHLG